MVLITIGPRTYLQTATGALLWLQSTADVATYQALGVPGPKAISTTTGAHFPGYLP